MVGRGLKAIAAMGIIGEGVIGALFPRRHTLLWKFGPKKYRKFIEASARRPNLVRIAAGAGAGLDRKSTRLNSSHLGISYAVFCLKKKIECNKSTTKNIETRS